MAKIYGGRWEVLSSLASGGQAEVFKVHDLQKEYPGEFVLKRVRNPKRHDRFRAEVEAIKRLNHPNIIRLIDHSALSSDDLPPDRQFIVMPYASQGDLSSRVALYANNPDSVVQVAKSLALGLQAAHAAGIIHRDVKPENVLFPTVTHDVWLGDFGICLIRDLDRRTLADEVVGPAQFMAPELEGGGQLAVSPAADVYSLGKVIFYMLSGGTVLPRERLHDPDYAKILLAGERQRLFVVLLSRMVCTSLQNRLASMDEVLDDLSRIESWERDARLIPIQPSTLSAIEEMKRKALEVHRQIEVNADIRTRRQAAVAATLKGTLDWFQAELEKTAALIDDGQNITAGVRTIENGKNDSPILNDFRPGPAVELWVRNKSEVYQREHLLRFSVGTKVGFSVTTRVITGAEPSMQVPQDEPEHVELMVVPAYGRKTEGTTPNRKTDWQLFTVDGRLHRPVTGQNQNPHRQSAFRGIPRPQMQQPVHLRTISFSTAAWPSAASEFPAILQQTADVFISAMNMAGPFG
jgi:serine/threonine protein kinase